MFPEIFKIGPFILHSYGLMLALALMVGIWLMGLQAAERGISKDLIVGFGVFVMAGSVVGSRLMYVITHWSEYASSPWQALAVWEGGLTFYGGFILGTLATVIYCRVRKVSFWTFADMAAPGFALGLALGRIGCFLNGCCFGHPSDLPWAVIFPAQSAAGSAFSCAVHPTQIYESLFGFAAFGLLWLLRNKNKFSGLSTCMLFLLYGIWRFTTDQFRYYDQSQRWWLGFTNNQWISLVAIIIAIGTGLILRSTKQEK